MDQGAVFRFSDAIYMPLAAQRVVNANKAGVHAANNDAMLATAEAYFDLQQACGLLAISREAVANAKELSDVTGSYARTGQGLEADHRRALTELNHRRKECSCTPASCWSPRPTWCRSWCSTPSR